MPSVMIARCWICDRYLRTFEASEIIRRRHARLVQMAAVNERRIGSQQLNRSDLEISALADRFARGAVGLLRSMILLPRRAARARHFPYRRLALRRRTPDQKCQSAGPDRTAGQSRSNDRVRAAGQSRKIIVTGIAIACEGVKGGK